MITIDHVVIAVAERERSNAIDRDAVGAELIDTGQVTWRYRFGAQQLGVHGPGTDPSPGMSVLFRDPDASLLDFIVDDD